MNQSIDFATNVKNELGRRIRLQPTYFSMGYPVHGPCTNMIKDNASVLSLYKSLSCDGLFEIVLDLV